ncbi:hypothetical protein [Escherichia phage vB_EcoM_EP57]|nr:hypothetical protein [Escherichia phage vB_EcoM_EP57]
MITQCISGLQFHLKILIQQNLEIVQYWTTNLIV